MARWGKWSHVSIWIAGHGYIFAVERALNVVMTAMSADAGGKVTVIFGCLQKFAQGGVGSVKKARKEG